MCKFSERNTSPRVLIRSNTLQHTATHCIERNTSPRVLIRINTLQHTATHCNTLQHTATHCDTHTHTHQHTHDTSPRGGFVFTMFPDQEPCVRGPPSKNLVQILRGGSSYARLEGTGTRPDYLMIVMPKKMRGHSRKKLHKNREIIV